MLDSIKNFILGHKWAMVLAFVCVVPYLAFQNMKARTAAEELDATVPGLKISRDASKVYYLDGSTKPPDGFAITVMTADDYKNSPDTFKKSGYIPKPEDLPVVVFFNLSGFDSSGDPGIIRRAADGVILFELKDKPAARLRTAHVHRNGKFTIYSAEAPPATIEEEDWYRDYMGVQAPVPLPPQETLDKMTPEELAKIGLTRVNEAEYVKKTGGLPATTGKAPGGPPAASPPTAVEGGLRGSVVSVGGVPAIQPLAVDVYLFSGAFDAATTGAILAKTELGPTFAEYLQKHERFVARTRSAVDGTYKLTVPPGTYTMMILGGRGPLGNSRTPGVWPSVTVGAGWTDYDFRVTP